MADITIKPDGTDTYSADGEGFLLKSIEYLQGVVNRWIVRRREKRQLAEPSSFGSKGQEVPVKWEKQKYIQEQKELESLLIFHVYRTS